MNFLVNSSKGSMCIKSTEVSEIVKDATLLFKVLNNMVEEDGGNMIHVVTNNASVSASAKTLNNGVDYNHLIEHALACTLKRNDEDVSYVNDLRFTTIDEVLNVRQMRLN